MAKTTTSSAHTPGPWFKYRGIDGDIVIKAERGGRDCVVASCLYDEENEPTIEELEANARLIAAAPELLETLKLTYEAMTDGSITDTGSPIPYLVEKAIAKAEGRG